MAPHARSILLAALACAAVAQARADEFQDRCSALSRDLKITVDYQDRDVVTDESRTVEALTTMTGRRPGGSHNVYGLTHAIPSFQMAVTPRAVMSADGRYCALPAIAVTLGFSEFQVYLARELVDRCRREIIWEHEEEHVKTWKSHLRASAKMLATILQREAGEARIYESREATEAGIRAWANDLVTPWAKRILELVTDAQKVIDTPSSYAEVAGRLRRCPGPMR